MPPKIIINRGLETEPSLVLLDLSEATAQEATLAASLLGLKTRHSRFKRVPLGVLPAGELPVFTNHGKKVFSKLQLTDGLEPIEETLMDLGAAWLAEITAKT